MKYQKITYRDLFPVVRFDAELKGSLSQIHESNRL